MYAAPKDRLVPAIGTSAILLGIGWLLLFGLSVAPVPVAEQAAVPMIEVALPRPQPVRQPQPRKPRASAKAGAASTANLRTPKLLPSPPPPAPPPVLQPRAPVALPVPLADTGRIVSGASDRAGRGAGVGSEGNGTGTGDGGNGDGDGGGDVPPRQIRGRLRFSDLPADLREGWTGGEVGVRYRVEVDGSVTNCRVTRSSGSRELDFTTCRLIEQRFRFRPSLTADGEPVRSLVEETHGWTVDLSDRSER